MLLALLGRWIELLHSLQIAAGAAERLTDDIGKAWALHEQGTWQLVAGNHAEADELLGKARDQRRQIGDRLGLAVTERNLRGLCRVLRADLHKRKGLIERTLENPLLAGVLAVLLLVVGGAVGAIVASSTDSTSGPAAASGAPTKTLAAQTAGSSTAPTVTGQSNGSTTSSASTTPTGTTSKSSAGAGSTSAGSGGTAPTKGSSATTEPSAPARVTANVGDAGVTVAWTAPADGGSTITSYTITPYLGAEALPTKKVEGSPPATTAAVSGLASGASYTFTVTAKNAIGEGPASEHSNPVTP
jgi:hypothetical protein